MKKESAMSLSQSYRQDLLDAIQLAEQGMLSPSQQAFTEFQIMSDMERMIGEWMQLIYWNSFLFACSVSRRCFLCHATYSCGFLIALKYPDLTPKMYPKIVYFLLKMYPKGIFA